MNQIDIARARELADRLAVLEAAASPSDDDLFVTCRICEKLRRSLIGLTGTAGYSSLLSRALTLAKRESPALAEVQTRPDGSLEGLKGEAAKAGPVLIAHLINLLITFIGEALTMRILQNVWPDFARSEALNGRVGDA